MALYIFQQPQTWRIFTSGFHSFSVAAGGTAGLNSRVNPACGAAAPVIPLNWPADCFSWAWCDRRQRHRIRCSVTGGDWHKHTWLSALNAKHTKLRGTSSVLMFLLALSFGRCFSLPAIQMENDEEFDVLLQQCTICHAKKRKEDTLTSLKCRN